VGEFYLAKISMISQQTDLQMVENPNVLLKALKIQFKYFCVDNFSLPKIKSIFSSFGFTVNQESTVSTETRRGLVDELYNSGLAECRHSSKFLEIA
jgi:hypothetical protein